MKRKLLFPMICSLMLCMEGLSSIAAENRIDLLGDPAPPSAATRTIVINPDNRYVNVEGGQIVKFVVGDRAFAWNFSGSLNVWSFDLTRVAPAGMLDHEVMAYIAPDPRYRGP